MLDNTTIETIKNYANRDLPDESFYDNLFQFITNETVRNQILKEYKNIRFVYKILEGLQVENDLLYFETKTQIIMYASIHEMVITWVLFNYFDNSPDVQELTSIKTLKRYSISPDKLVRISSALVHDSKDIIPCFEKIDSVDRTKIRFDSKVDAAYKLGLISEQMKKDLIKIFEYRNTVHIEATLKKNLDYTLEISKLAYRRVEGLNIELSNALKNMGLWN